MPTLHVPCIPSHQETGLLVAGFRPYLTSDALNTMLPVLPEFRTFTIDDHTLNELHFDYSVPNPYDTTAELLGQPSTRSNPGISGKPSAATQDDSDDVSMVYGGGNNCNGFEYYDLSPTAADFDSPMDDLPADELYRMFVRSPSPVEALL